MQTGKARVFGIDAQELVLDGLRARVERNDGLEWAGQLTSIEGAVDAVAGSRPDVVVLDPGVEGGFEAVRGLRQAAPDARVLVLSGRMTAFLVERAIRAGAWGFAGKQDGSAAVIEVIGRIVRGESFVLGPSAVAICGQIEHKPGARAPELTISAFARLTERELQVLRHIGAGLTRSAIAEEMHRSAKTVDTHRMAIMEKLDVRDRGMLIRLAIREGLVDA